MRGNELLAWICALPSETRESVVETYLGIDSRVAWTPPGDHMVGYHPSGVEPIVRAIVDTPVVEGDVLIDIGSGLGKVVLLAHLLTGASARGVEIQEGLVHHARSAAARLDAAVSFVHADARHVDFSDGTVFFLYTPVTGPALDEVLLRLRRVAAHHAIVVCALGLDLYRHAPWLRARPTDAFWLTIYDSAEPEVPARRPAPSALAPLSFEP